MTQRVLLAAALLGFVAQVQSISAERTYPRWDEVQYLSLARDYAKEGGALATIRCHLEGRCLEDIRHPLYQLLIQAVVDDQPRSFADAKLVTFATGLALLALVYFVTRRRLGAARAATTTVLLSFTSILLTMSASLVHDVLFAWLFFAAVTAMADWQERPAAPWLGVGALIGLAYLTKGIGHLLFIPLVVTGVYRWRQAFFRRGILYAALVGFAAAAFFLLWRNLKVFGNPFHNISIHAAWIDQWEDIWWLSRSPEWDKIGMGWYLRNHSLLDLAWRMFSGFGITLGVFIYSAGLLTAMIVPGVISGVLVLALAGWGMVLRYRDGHRIEIVAIGTTAALFIVSFSFGAAAGLTAPRYTFPILLLLLPFAAVALHARVFPWLAQRVPLPALGAVLVAGRLLFFGGGLLANPRSYFGVTADWHETSVWLSEHLAPGESFGLPYHSYYSTWDVPHPGTDPRWSYSYRTELALMKKQMHEGHIVKLLVDAEDVDRPTYQDRFSAEADAHGPLRFLDWPRCFADRGTPSRFQVYCAPP